MHIKVIWCASLDAWIRIHSNDNDLIQIEVAKTDNNSFGLTRHWEPLKSYANPLLCQLEDEKITEYYYDSENKSLYRFEGMNRLTKAEIVSKASVHNGELYWSQAKNPPLIARPSEEPGIHVAAKPLTPEAQNEKWLDIKKTSLSSRIGHKLGRQLSNDHREELFTSFAEVLDGFNFNTAHYDTSISYLKMLQEIIENKENDIHKKLLDQAARTVEYNSIALKQSAMYPVKEKFFMDLLREEYNCICNQLGVPEHYLYQTEQIDDVAQSTIGTQGNEHNPSVAVEVQYSTPNNPTEAETTTSPKHHDTLLTELSQLQEVIKQYEPNSLTLTLKEQMILRYSAWVVNNVSSILQQNDGDKTQRLRDFLSNNWSLVNKTLLSPLTLPQAPIHSFLCNIARQVAGKDKSALHCLMPDISLESINDDYPSLTEKLSCDEQLETLLKTHIISDDGFSLIPVKILLTLDVAEKPNLFNPYFDYELQDSSAATLSKSEYKRLFEHSDYTRAVHSLREHHASLLQKSNSLLGELTVLCTQLELNSVGGRGIEENAAAGAYPAIVNFNQYYQKLDQRRIPQSLKTAIELLLSLASDPKRNSNATQTISTCIALRRAAIVAGIRGNEQLLEHITLSESTKTSLLFNNIENYAKAQQVLKESLESNNYDGQDTWGLTPQLAQKIGITLRISTFQDLNLIKQLSAEEMHVFLCDTRLQNEINAQIKSIDDLFLFLSDLSLEKTRAFMIIMLPLLIKRQINRPVDQSALIAVLNPEQSPLVERLITTIRDHRSFIKNIALNKTDTILGKFTPQELSYIVTTFANCDINLMCFAAENYPEAIEPILAAIPKEQVASLLMQTQRFGWNALMVAACYNATAVVPILAAMPKEQVAKFLLETDVEGQNVLTIAADYNPTAVAPILAALPKEQLAHLILQQKSRDICRLIVPKCNSTDLALIFSALTTEQAASIISRTSYGKNALMAAADYNPTAVEPILAALPKEQVASFILKTNDDGWNALKFAVYHNPTAGRPMIDAIIENDLNMLMKNTKTLRMVQNFMVRYTEADCSATACTIIRALDGKDDRTIDLMLAFLKPLRQKKFLSESTSRLNEVKIAIELIMLKKELSLFKTDSPRYKVAEALYINLKTQTTVYLNSTKDNQALLTFTKNCIEQLNKKDNNILHLHRDRFWSICQTIRAWFFKIIYGLSKEESSLNSSGFKATTTANIKNRLQNLVNAAQETIGNQDNREGTTKPGVGTTK